MKQSKVLRQDKGIAGLTIFLSVVTFLFMLGLLVSIFAIMGGGISDSSIVSAGRTETVTDLSNTVTAGAVAMTRCNQEQLGAISSISSVTNGSLGTLTVANYTFSDCNLLLLDAGINATNDIAVVNYTYSYAGESYRIITNTTSGIANVTDWFDIFIVISAMVVLILLTVIIITAIRGSGLMGVGGSSGGNKGNVGSA